jgi:hypothetical protein
MNADYYSGDSRIKIESFFLVCKELIVKNLSLKAILFSLSVTNCVVSSILDFKFEIQQIQKLIRFSIRKYAIIKE